MEIGARYLGENQSRFTVWAPLCSDVTLHIVSPHERLVPLIRGSYNYWSSESVEVGPGSRYFFGINKNRDRPDPASRYQPEGVHGPSEVVDHTAFAWSDHGWKGIEPCRMIIYEMHIGCFTLKGTFDAAVEKLGYLKELGITAVEIMPVAQFPGSRNWGYDGAYPFAVQNTYGGPDGLKRLVDSCHRIGLAVVLDVVYNHFGPEGAYVSEFGPYFTRRYNTPWGAAINYDDDWSDGPRNFVVCNALAWFRDYHIDALRLDAIHGIYDTGARHILREIAEETEMFSKANGRQRYLIAESDLNDTRIIAPIAENGYGVHVQWSDDFHHALHALLTGERRSYYGDFGSLDHLAKAYREGFVYSWSYSENRKRHHGSSSARVPGDQLLICTQNHDQIGNRLLGERLSALLEFDALKLAAAAMLTAPYIPLLFMGEEFAALSPFLYFISHSDEKLVQAVRDGRAQEFAAFKWEGDFIDPQSEGTFKRSILDWNCLQQGKHATMLAFYCKLLELRRSYPALSNLRKDHTTVRPFGETGVLVVHRRETDNTIALLMNFSDQYGEIPASVLGHSGTLLIDSSDAAWGGENRGIPPQLGNESTVIIQRFGFAAFDITERE